jgi:uncharacterized protein YabE (DUF348 family)
MRQRVRRKLMRAGLVGLLVAATLGYGVLEKTVTVRIEGEIRPVKTFALTVGDALERAGVVLGPQDRVVPSLDTALHEGSDIKIYRAKPITILLNGKQREVIVTSLTVEDVLREIALRRSMRDYVGASRSARVYPGMTIEYRQAVALTVVHDDKTERIITNAPTVRKMLSELGVVLGAKDKVRPGLDVYPSQGMTVKVLRVGERKETTERIIPSATQTKQMKSIEYGRTRTVQVGRPGLRVYRYLSTYVDGVRVKRKLLKVELVRKPVPTIVGIGAGFPSCPCNKGTEEGGASWFGAEGLTAAHKTLPKGTVVKVTNVANGKSVNVVIRDRGPYVKGRIIDLSTHAFKRLAPLGTGVIRVKIRW